jgi:hypothetical protein
MKKLITLNEFTEDIADYVNESMNFERGLKYIFAYNDFLNQPIKEDMFIGENPLFYDFEKRTQAEAVCYGIEKSFHYLGNNEYSVCIYKKYGNENKKGYVTSYHLKTINDLVGKIDIHNNVHPKYGWSQIN